MQQYFNKHLRHLSQTLGWVPPQPSTTNDAAIKAQVITPLQQAILDKIEVDYQLAEQYFNKSFPRPLVQFTLRGKSAGTAHLQLNKLRFNPVLLAENVSAFIDDVVPHEISHLICFQVFGRVKPHGAEWQSIMRRVYGRAPKTTHKLDTLSVRGKQFEYFCGCGSVQLSIRRHNNVVRGKTQYRCKTCQQMLQSAPV
ncbi:SprT family zinc-dependent metalloprotease [Shewanella subflava]|uniref:Protein SprT n=1 Tax=Shewanella subflava TaxID=2986476 RepID=A0ABT3I7B9_9GAMM|nr:SprT family zinc-dependent metalloprotease [Shewanella subflava]MCW3171879.1 SprT family zinc-dependent metalloprotease [Shewanella subflava]